MRLTFLWRENPHYTLHIPFPSPEDAVWEFLGPTLRPNPVMFDLLVSIQQSGSHSASAVALQQEEHRFVP